MVRFLSRPAARLACGCLIALGGAAVSAQDPLVIRAAAVVDVDDNASAADEPSLSGDEVETIQERYPNRTVKVERQVIQDSAGNYINHGTWSQWDERGRL